MKNSVAVLWIFMTGFQVSFALAGEPVQAVVATEKSCIDFSGTYELKDCDGVEPQGVAHFIATLELKQDRCSYFSLLSRSNPLTKLPASNLYELDAQLTTKRTSELDIDRTVIQSVHRVRWNKDRSELSLFDDVTIESPQGNEMKRATVSNEVVFFQSNDQTLAMVVITLAVSPDLKPNSFHCTMVRRDGTPD